MNEGELGVADLSAKNNLTPEMTGYKAFNLRDIAGAQEKYSYIVVPNGFIVTTNFFNTVKRKLDPAIRDFIRGFAKNNTLFIQDVQEHLSEKYKEINDKNVKELAENISIDDFLFLILKTSPTDALYDLWVRLSEKIDSVLNDLDKELENIVKNIQKIIINNMQCTKIFVRSSSTLSPQISIYKPGGIFKSIPYLKSDLEKRAEIKDALMQIYKSIFTRILAPHAVAENGYTEFSMAILFQVFNDSFLSGIIEIERGKNIPDKAKVGLQGVRGECGLLLNREEWLPRKERDKEIQPEKYRCPLNVADSKQELKWFCVAQGHQECNLVFDTVQKKMCLIYLEEVTKIFEQNDLKKLGSVILILYSHFKYPTYQRIEFSIPISREKVYILQNDYLNEHCS